MLGGHIYIYIYHKGDRNQFVVSNPFRFKRHPYILFFTYRARYYLRQVSRLPVNKHYRHPQRYLYNPMYPHHLCVLSRNRFYCQHDTLRHKLRFYIICCLESARCINKKQMLPVILQGTALVWRQPVFSLFRKRPLANPQSSLIYLKLQRHPPHVISARARGPYTSTICSSSSNHGR